MAPRRPRSAQVRPGPGRDGRERRPVVAIVGLVLLACTGDGTTRSPPVSPSDAGGSSTSDATAPDTGPGVTVQCGPLWCGSTQLCRVTPTAPCVSTDGGPCPAGQEACESAGVAGCTSPQTRECIEIPATCAAQPSCACLINAALCPGNVHYDCRRAMDMGYVVECPF